MSMTMTSFRSIKTECTFLLFLFFGVLLGCNSKEKENKTVVNFENPIIGKWVRTGNTGAFSFDFQADGLVYGDFGNNKAIDVVATYEIQNDTIKFLDKEGQMCEGFGMYKVYQTDYYLAFDLIKDNCGGRIKTTMGFWTKSNFKESLAALDKEISNSPKPETLLNRARVYMAIGKLKQAKNDFDRFILNDTTRARVYINRAGTRFPNDLEGVVQDCNIAISLEPNSKNAYFLRALASYDLGNREKACEDFEKAIELGFSILRMAEKEKCSEFWNKSE